MWSRRRKEAGFTLIELLVVVSILGILAAIAIPSFVGRQGKAFDARIIEDARNAASAQEAYFVDNGTYYEGSNCNVMPGMNVSDGTSCSAALTASGFEIETTHPRASRTCHWSTATLPNLSCS